MRLAPQADVEQAGLLENRRIQSGDFPKSPVERDHVEVVEEGQSCDVRVGPEASRCKCTLSEFLPKCQAR